MIICNACPSESDCRIYGSCLNTTVIMAQQRVKSVHVVDLMHVTHAKPANWTPAPASEWATQQAIATVMAEPLKLTPNAPCWHFPDGWGKCKHCGQPYSVEIKQEKQPW